MIEFGKTLREAREAAGLTVAQLAEKTHMPPSRIEQLEAEDFSKIPAAIYGRGFVRLYCEAVGIDPKPLSDEFTAIFNGHREPEIKERVVEAPKPEAGRAGVPPPAAEKDSRLSTFDSGATSAPDFQLAAETIAAPKAVAAPEPPPEPVAAPEPPPAAAPSLSRYAAPVREARPSLNMPPSVWRFAVLGIVAIVVLWLAFLGVRALYRATADDPADIRPSTLDSAAPAQSVKSVKSVANPAAPARTPQKIPELYID